MANFSTLHATPLPEAHTPCVDCGYDLFGCADSGHCPECGRSVADSLRPLRILRDPAQARYLMLSLNAWSVALAMCGISWAMLLLLIATMTSPWRPVIFFVLIAPPTVHGFASLWAVALMPLKQVWPSATRMYHICHWAFGIACFLGPIFSGLMWSLYLLRDQLSFYRWDILMLLVGVLSWFISSLIAGAGLTRLLGHWAATLEMWPQARAMLLVWFALAPQILAIGLLVITLALTGILDGGVLFVLTNGSILIVTGAWLFLLRHLLIIRRRVKQLAQTMQAKIAPISAPRP